MRSTFAAALVLPLLLPQFGWLNRKPDYFTPSNTLTGIGVSRETISESVLAKRTELMIDSQTFAIMRDPEALAGAQRITKLAPLFARAEQASGLPADFIAAVAYLESWGRPTVQSYAGPKGMMQIAAGTAQAMGLRIVYGKRYRTVVEKRKVRNKKGKVVWQRRTRRVPYQVLLRDERLIPEKAVPAAARYLARLEQKFGGRDWATFAYHCGEGCISRLQELTQRSDLKQPITVPRAFFGAHPALNRELYDSLQSQPFSFYENIHRYVLRPGGGAIVLVRLGRTAVAGALFLHGRDTVVMKFAASDLHYQQLRINNLALWEAMKHYGQAGYGSMDFGRTSLGNEGLRAFKRRWGAEEHNIPYHRYDVRRGTFVQTKDAANTKARLFQHLPVPVSRWAGRILYRHMA